MKFFTSIFVYVLVAGGLSFPVEARWRTNSARECYLDDDGNNWFWFCGTQSKSCDGTSVCCDNRVEWNYHGDSFTYHSTRYWCCGGSGSASGTYIQGDNWIVKTETVKETLPEGKCTWQRKTNICGGIDNPGDKCTEATEDCTAGYVSHGGKCVPACAEGEAFASTTSPTCVPCESTSRQGVKKSVCIKCEANQLFDNNTLSCVNLSSKVQVSTAAYNDCWMCATPGAVYNCLKAKSSGKNLSTDLQKACDVDNRNARVDQFSLPDYSSKFKSAFNLIKKEDKYTLTKLIDVNGIDLVGVGASRGKMGK